MNPPVGGKRFFSGKPTDGSLRTPAYIQESHGCGGLFRKDCIEFQPLQLIPLGSELRIVSREIVKLIIKANSAREKLPVLYEVRAR